MMTTTYYVTAPVRPEQLQQQEQQTPPSSSAIAFYYLLEAAAQTRTSPMYACKCCQIIFWPREALVEHLRDKLFGPQSHDRQWPALPERAPQPAPPTPTPMPVRTIARKKQTAAEIQKHSEQMIRALERSLFDSP